MTITEFVTLLESIGMPVALNRFSETQKPPYIVYFDVGSENFSADNVVYCEFINIDVELYTTHVNDALENQIKQLFTDNEIYYEWSRNWIEQEKIYQTTFEVII
jgi:hypothetical protein